MKIVPRQGGKAEFLSLWKSTLEDGVIITRQDPKRLLNLRCSQLPYCPRSVLLNYVQRGMLFPMSASMDYYVSVGTAVHSMAQRHLPMSGSLLANYHCHECGKRYPMSYVHECCGFSTSYDEVAVDYRGIQGHIDCVWKDSKGRLWIVDFKTTSLGASLGKLRNPGKGYVRQIRAYAYLLWKQYGLKVAGVMLFFIPRDNPRKPVAWEYIIKDGDWEDIRLELKHDRILHKKTMVASTVEDIKALAVHTCGGDYCETCKLSRTQWTSKVIKGLKKLPIIQEKERLR